MKYLFQPCCSHGSWACSLSLRRTQESPSPCPVLALGLHLTGTEIICPSALPWADLWQHSSSWMPTRCVDRHLKGPYLHIFNIPMNPGPKYVVFNNLIYNNLPRNGKFQSSRTSLLYLYQSQKLLDVYQVCGQVSEGTLPSYLQ